MSKCAIAMSGYDIMIIRYDITMSGNKSWLLSGCDTIF